MGGREQGSRGKPVPWESMKTALWASNTRSERRDVIFRKAIYNAETGTSYGEIKQRESARGRDKKPENEAGRQKFRLNLRGSDYYPHLGGFVVTKETGIVGDFRCADLHQMVPVGIKEETPDLGFVFEAKVLANYRTGLRCDPSARPKQPEVAIVSRVESEVQEKIKDDQPNFGREGE